MYELAFVFDEGWFQLLLHLGWEKWSEMQIHVDILSLYLVRKWIYFVLLLWEVSLLIQRATHSLTHRNHAK